MFRVLFLHLRRELFSVPSGGILSLHVVASSFLCRKIPCLLGEEEGGDGRHQSHKHGRGESAEGGNREQFTYTLAELISSDFLPDVVRPVAVVASAAADVGVVLLQDGLVAVALLLVILPAAGADDALIATD